MNSDMVRALAVCGTALAIVALVMIAVSIYCLKAYFANSVYDLNNNLWALQDRILDTEPLLPKSEIVNEEVAPNPCTRQDELHLEDIETLLRGKLPRYSVTYGGNSVDVFANVRESQVYCIAQDYFENSQPQATTSQRNAVDVGKMEVFPLLTSKFKRPKRQRPKSIYYDDSSDGAQLSQNSNGLIFPGMYMSKTIGPDGGSISIQGARLTIPFNALSVSTEICLGVVWKSDRGPKLESQQALLSSVVACEPHDLKFQVPVNLEIYHCAQMRKEWVLEIMTSNTSVFEDPEWKALSHNDITYREFGKSSVGLRLTRFSQFAVLGKTQDKEVATKMVMLVPFAPPVTPGENLEIRVYCVDDYNSNSADRQEVLFSEDELDEHAKRVHPPQPLFIRDTGADVHIELTDVSEKWQIEGASKLVLDFNVVWQSGRPACSFTCKPKSRGATDEFTCTAVGFQQDQPDKKSRMRIVQRQQIPQKDNIRTAIKKRENEDARKGSRKTSTQEIFPLNLRTKLIQLLEPDDKLHNNDWKQVANHLKLPFREIRFLESQRGTRHGPMESLLQLWEHENKTLQEFADLMKDIRRIDVLNTIENYKPLVGHVLPGPPYPFPRRMHKTLKRLRRGTISNHFERGRSNTNPPNNAGSNTRWHREYLRQTSSSGNVS